MIHGPKAGRSSPSPGAAYQTGFGWRSRRGWRGRSSEWTAVADLLRTAMDGRSGVLVVEGEPGIGKSRLLSEAIEAGTAAGFMLSQGTADEAGQLAPMASLMSMFGDHAEILRAAQEDCRPDMVDLRLRMVGRLQTYLEQRAARGRLLITFDDLQWADPTTLLALRSLISELSSYPLAWILSRTTGDAAPEVDRLFEVLERDGATRIMLGALDDGAVAEIVTDEFNAAPEPALLELVNGAAGNPFSLAEVLGVLREEGVVEIIGGRARLVAQEVPERIREFARSRLDRMSARGRHLLQVAAVLGCSFSVEDLAGMLGEPAGQLVPALREAEAAGAVVPSRGMAAFRHDLIWRAVEGSLATPVRQALHRQAGQMLLSRGGSAIPAARHLMHNARPGDERAIACLDQAAQEVLSSSPQTAADLACRALELTSLSDGERFERMTRAVYSLTLAGRLSEAADLARTALRQTSLPEEVARMRYELAYLLYLAGKSMDAVTEVESLLSQRDLSDELRGLAESVLFRGWLVGHQYERGRERAEATVACAKERPVPAGLPAVVGAHMLLSYASWQDGCAGDALGHVREAVRVADGLPMQSHRAHPGLHLVLVLTDLGRFDDAERVLRGAAEEITELGHTAYAPSPALFRARLRLFQGRLDDAATEAQAGLAVADEMGAYAFSLLGVAVLIVGAVRRGDLDAAVAYVEQYRSWRGGGHGMTFLMAWADWGMALVADAEGDRRRAVEVLHASYTDPAERRWLLMSEQSAAAWMTRTALAVGDRSGAELIVATAEHLARRNPEVATLAASAAQARGVLDDDPVRLARAAETHVGPWNRASAAEDLGALLTREAGDSDAAIRSLDQALDGYQHTGAFRDAARVRARLRRLGVRRHWSQSERPVSGWGSLTDTERNVATLVAQGLTNTQVAAQMFLSPNTVKLHLHQVFRKLSVASRVELVRLVAERPPGGAPPSV